MATYNFLTRGVEKHLFSLVIAREPKETTWSCVSGRSDWKVVGNWNRLPRALVTKSGGVQEVFGQCCQTQGLNLGGALRARSWTQWSV